MAMTVNYPELGAPGAGALTYKEGDKVRHPSGVLYQLQPDGKTWTPRRRSDQSFGRRR